MEEPMSADKIRVLNDSLRRTFAGGRGMMTAGVAALPELDLAAVLARVRRFAEFNPDNDPHGEHDLGRFELAAGYAVIWKIDYYDARLEFGSEDPADPAQTTRVLTIMLA